MPPLPRDREGEYAVACWEVSRECPRLAYPWREPKDEDSLVMDTGDLMKGGQIESDVSKTTH